MDRVIVFPRSGYINRLQATASAALLAEDLGADFLICWEPQAVAASPASSVFAPEYCASRVLDLPDVRTRFGIDIESLPRYLDVDPQRSLITLAGHDHGEQRYMAALRDAISHSRSGATVVITAGGHYFLPRNGVPTDEQHRAFLIRRGEWYRQLSLQPDIEASATRALAEHLRFLALHLRYTDRSLQAPTDRQIAAALEELGTRSDASSLFIASDVPAKRDLWFTRAMAMGFSPWFIEHPGIDRSNPRSAHPALIDWRILGSADALVYFTESSFAHEAAVAAGNVDSSIGLSAHSARTRLRSAAQVVTSAATWPQRRFRS